MSKLAERIRKNREFKVTVGRWTFIARRPTEEQGGPLLQEIFSGEANARLTAEQCARISRDYVIDWKGVIEDDLIGGGNQEEVKFDAEDWSEFVADHREVWEPIAIAVIEGYLGRLKEQQDAEKNSSPG